MLNPMAAASPAASGPVRDGFPGATAVIELSSDDLLGAARLAEYWNVSESLRQLVAIITGSERERDTTSRQRFGDAANGVSVKVGIDKRGIERSALD